MLQLTEGEIWEQCSTKLGPELRALADAGAFAYCIDETGDRGAAKRLIRWAFPNRDDIRFAEINVLIADIVMIVGYNRTRLCIVRNS